MAKKTINWKTKGMNRDMSVSAFSPEFAFENINIRLATNEGNTMMSWVNERGPKHLTLKIDTTPFNGEISKKIYETELRGIPIGTAVLNHKLVIFTTKGDESPLRQDLIYVLEKSDNTEECDFTGKLLFYGSLGFSVDYPLETLVSYESETIQKVYWTDNKSQPRVINIAPAMDHRTQDYNNHTFDFVKELQLKEQITVTKVIGAGEFPPGVIQYAFTYYNKYGQESNIFYTTPLQYISYADRGGSPESKIANSFRINVKNVDRNFDYLRIYSILRTSLNATPLVKRVQDIEITNDEAYCIDDGLQGDTVDPTELLYKGGEEVKVKTMEQKDGTLFLGNIEITRPPLDVKGRLLSLSGVMKAATITPLITNKDILASVLTKRPFLEAAKSPFWYINTLSCPESEEYQGAACFKAREYYRLGVQFQYKNGKWSEPCWIGDARQQCFPKVDDNLGEKEGLSHIYVPEFKYNIKDYPKYKANGEKDNTYEPVFSILYNAGYRKARPVFVVPNQSDRTILCQGVGCPTMYRKVDRYSDAEEMGDEGIWSGSSPGTLYAQSSWLFRVPVVYDTKNGTNIGDAFLNKGGNVSYLGKLNTQFNYPYANVSGDSSSADYLKAMFPWLRNTEIMGIYDDGHSFYIDPEFATIHTPELIFDDSFSCIDFNGCSIDKVGGAKIIQTYGDIDIQTSTPPIGSDSAGFIHRSIVTDGGAALITGLFFNDYLVDELKEGGYEAYKTSNPAIYFPVYMWQKNGSLNNDVQRDNRSAELLTKKISNYRLSSKTDYKNIDSCYTFDTEDIQLFNADTLSMIKVNGHTYMGNIEAMFTPTTPSPHFLVGDPFSKNVDVDFNSDFNPNNSFLLQLEDPDDTDSKSGVWNWQLAYNRKNGELTWQWLIKDKTAEQVGDYVKGLCQWREPISIKYKSTPHIVTKINNGGIYYSGKDNGLEYDTMPMMEIVRPYNEKTFCGGVSDEALQAATWIPCGPVVAFEEDTTELSLYYKWGDSYFQRFECLKTYPYTNEDKNQVVEIASFMCESRVNMDGRYDRNRGQTSNINMSPQNFNLLNPVYSQMDNFFSYKIVDAASYKNTCFPTNITWTKTKQNGADVDLWTNITLANVLEMDGDKGAVNKLTRLNNQLIAFQDSGFSQILYNENTQISTTEGVPIEIANSEKVQGKRYYSDTVGCSNKWSVVSTPNGIYFMDSNEKSIYLFNGQLGNLSTSGGFNTWTKNTKDINAFIAHYDRQNQEVVFANDEGSLAYSEKFGCFTSFYDYTKKHWFCNLDNMGIWTDNEGLWEHQAGEYCNFFGVNKPFSMTLIGNQEPQVDKIFTNMEFRACVEGEGTYDTKTGKFTPLLPFDTLEVWNEYQHGKLLLTNRNNGEGYNHDGSTSFLTRKFRIWRCDIPRDNAPVSSDEAAIGIRRFKVRPLDRIRNTWAYLKLQKHAASGNNFLSKVEIHDIVASYF